MKNIWNKIFILCVPLISSFAETGSGASNPPIDISAASGVNIFDSENRLEAYDQVSISRSEATIYGDKATVFYEKKNDKRQPTQLRVTGKVISVSPQATIYSDQAQYNVATEKLSFLGRQIKLFGLSANIKAHKNLDYYPQKKKAVARGSVEMVDIKSPQKIYGDEVTFYFRDAGNDTNTTNPNKKKSPVKSAASGSNEMAHSLDYVEAHGHVKVVLPAKIATGDHASFKSGENVIEMWGNVLVTDDNKQLRGAYAIVYKNEGQSKVYAEIPAHKAPKGQAKKQQKNKRVKIVLLPQ